MLNKKKRIDGHINACLSASIILLRKTQVLHWIDMVLDKNF